eukprot:1161961-Pelagomonas_calceolata.AAC.9
MSGKAKGTSKANGRLQDVQVTPASFLQQGQSDTYAKYPSVSRHFFCEVYKQCMHIKAHSKVSSSFICLINSCIKRLQRLSQYQRVCIHTAHSNKFSKTALL